MDSIEAGGSRASARHERPKDGRRAPLGRASVLTNWRPAERGERVGRVHAGEQSRRIAEARELLVAQRLGVGQQRVQQSPGATRPSLEQRSAGRQNARGVPGTERLGPTLRPMHRDHGACAGFPAAAQLPQQLRGHERHVPRADQDRRSLGGAKRCRQSAEWAQAGRLVGHDTLTRKPLRRRGNVGDHELSRGRDTQRGKRAVGDAEVVQPRESLGLPPETTRGAPREEDADTRSLADTVHVQIRSPRCSAARSSSVVSARSTMNDSTPRRGRSLMKRPQALHITRS